MILFESLPDPWGKNIIVPVSLSPWKKSKVNECILLVSL